MPIEDLLDKEVTPPTNTNDEPMRIVLIPEIDYWMKQVSGSDIDTNYQRGTNYVKN